MAMPLMSDEITVTAAEVQHDFGAVLQRLHQQHEHAVIQSEGQAVAVLLSVAEYEQLLRYKRLLMFDKLTRELGHAVEKSGVTEEQATAELEVTKQEVFRERYAGLH